MKYFILILGCLMLGGCNLIPNEDPDVNTSLRLFIEAIQASDDAISWNLLSSNAQAALDEPTFRMLVSTGAEYEDLIALFRTADITTRNRPRDIKTEHYIQMTNLSGSTVSVRFVMTQEPDGSWRVANLLAE